MQLDTTSLSTFALQGLGGLFVEMNATIKAQAIGQGISSTFFPKYETFQYFCADLGFNDEEIQILWNDTDFGLMDQNKYQPWISASFYGDQNSKNALLKHFLPMDSGILKKLLGELE